jgi:hypothetical protein
MPKTLERLLSCTPALKHLHYDHVRSVGWGSPQWADYDMYSPMPPYVSNIEERRRQCAECGKATQSLKQDFFHCKHLDAALEHVKDTRESLVLKFNFDAEYIEQIYDLHPGHRVTLCGTIGHLTIRPSMPLLRSVEAPWCAFFGWEADFPEHLSKWWTSSSLAAEFPLHSSPETWEFEQRFDWAAVLPLSSLLHLVLRDNLKRFDCYGTRNAPWLL